MIDITVIALYLLVTLYVGIHNRNKCGSLEGYNKLGKDLNHNIFILTATIFASSVGGGTTFGITQKAYDQNLAFTYGLILTIPIDILIGKYLTPRLSKYSGVMSIGGIISQHYGKTPVIITGIAAALISIGYLSAQISVSGIIFSFILDIDYKYAVIISYFIVILYTSIGGFRSVVINNSIQFVAMILAIPVLTIFGIGYIGLDQFILSVPESKYNIFASHGLLLDTIFAALSFSVMGFYPSFIQRVLAGRNADDISNAIYIKSGIYVFFLICLSLNGLIAHQLIPGIDPLSSLTSLIDLIIPIGIKGFILVGLLASVMSTADSDLNIAAISIVNDVLEPLNLASKKKLLYITKLLSMLIGSSAILLVLNFQSIVDLIIFSAGLWAPVAVVPLIGILFNAKISDKGFCICASSGSIVFLISQFYVGQFDLKISPVFFGTTASLMVFCFLKKEVFKKV